MLQGRGGGGSAPREGGGGSAPREGVVLQGRE